MVKYDIEKVKRLVEESKKYFPNQLGEFVFYRTYSRWIDEEGRRETWVETVRRYMNFMKENLGDKLSEEKYREIELAILKMEVMPSMRLVWSAGDAARKTHVAAYNCSYIAPTKIRDLGEILYILMCGTGVGFSVEEQYIQQFPQIKKQKGTKPTNFVVDDSKEGWANALIYGITEWYEGYGVEFDYSKLRDSGARLKTMGGKSAGPEPLKQLLNFTKEKILTRQGKRLQTIDLHDIICKIGEVVVMGGVRRSSLISLSDLDDIKMRNAKIGAFWIQEPQRQTANNSSVYLEKPDALVFIEEMLSLAKSRTGERGIFNRGSLNHQLPSRRLKVTNGKTDHYGTNPCGEIILRSKQFCNLSEVIARKDDTYETLTKKIEIATILGTYQATLTNFPFLSEEWRENCEKERLLGVSITGQYDCSVLFNDDGSVLSGLKNSAKEFNKHYSELFGINQSTAITCVKPSGTVSQLTDTSSGLHLRYSPYYIRRVRISNTDALFKMLIEQGVPYKPEVGQDKENAITFVLEFPVKSPDGIKVKTTALEQLGYWSKVKLNFTEHNPSTTITVKDNEWIDVINWLYNHWHNLGGLSFMPADNHAYQLAPYEQITEDKYNELISKFPNIDFSQIVLYEDKNELSMTGEIACTANGCEII